MKKIIVFFLLSFSCFNAQAMERRYVNIFYAALVGDVRAVQIFLDAGVPVDQAVVNTALMLAVDKGHESAVQLLLDYGASVNHACDEYGSTALMLAALRGHESVVRLLLANGASVNQVTKFCSTALMFAAKRGHEPCCKALIDHLLKIPNDTQLTKFYTFLMCMKQLGAPKDLRNYMKPYLRATIEQENRENPKSSIVLGEIKRIEEADMKQKLIATHWPHYKPNNNKPNNSWCVLQ